MVECARYLVFYVSSIYKRQYVSGTAESVFDPFVSGGDSDRIQR